MITVPSGDGRSVGVGPRHRTPLARMVGARLAGEEQRGHSGYRHVRVAHVVDPDFVAAGELQDRVGDVRDRDAEIVVSTVEGHGIQQGVAAVAGGHVDRLSWMR